MNFRTVDVSKVPQVKVADQSAPMLDWIQISKLVIDDDYQRPLGPKNWKAIEKIAKSFQWSRFTPVLVAPIADGMFAIIDGQHRAHAAAICGFASVPAMAVHMVRSEQASAFYWVNGQVTRMTPLQVYRAALCGGELWARECADVVEAAGCQLMTSNWSASQKKSGQIFTVGMIRGFVQAGFGDAVTAALKGLRGYDETGRVALWSEFVLKPFISAVADDVAFQSLDLTAFLKRHDPFKVMHAVAQMRNADKITSKSPAVASRDAFVTLLRAFNQLGAA